MSTSLPVESYSLHVPPLEEIARVLEDGLRQNFQEASVAVVDCPDLTQPPWSLAAPDYRSAGSVECKNNCGLCGSPRLLDIGGVPYLMPVVDRTKLYDLGVMVSLAELPGAFILGAGAASSRVAGVNCEMMPNARVPSGSSQGLNLTHIAKVSTQDGSCVLERFSSLESGPLANILACEGKPGKVLEIRSKHRSGTENFVTCMRKVLGGCYGDKPVGLGGVFLVAKGKAKLHVMPEFSEKPLHSGEDVNKWLRFYDMSAPLVCLSELISHDPDLDLRVEHTHCFSDHGEGGHYHCDITPEEVEYHAYYTLAERIYRIDRPSQTHQIGRD